MNVLFVAEDCPYPPNNGGRLRTYNLLKHLSLQHEITLVSPVETGINLDTALEHGLKRVIQVSPARQTVMRRLTSLVSQQPYIVCKYENPTMRVAVQSALTTGSFELLHCDSAMVARTIPVHTPIPKVLNMHNIEAVIWERYIAEERRPWIVPLLRSQLSKIAAFESQLPRLFDWCVAVSKRDREQMRLRYGWENVSVVQNGIDLDHYRPLPDPLKQTIVLIGSLDYRPNKDAVRWFIESIWPRVRADMPEANMLVIGRCPSGSIVDLCKRAGIHLHPDVPDTRPFLAEASLVVSPIRIGSGTRLKILEAMASARCVVSTTIGAEGLDVCDGEHLMIADEPSDFAYKVISMLRDPIRRQELARAGRSFVEPKLGWECVAAQMEKAWEKARTQSQLLPKLDMV